uniref:Uncharacterized protein n=1 Tax=Schistocephalus solidus TaxID=70667 RepID=A0A0X3Q5R2_SCHSO
MDSGSGRIRPGRHVHSHVYDTALHVTEKRQSVWSSALEFIYKAQQHRRGSDGRHVQNWFLSDYDSKQSAIRDTNRKDTVPTNGKEPLTGISSRLPKSRQVRRRFFFFPEGGTMAYKED